MQFCKTTIHLSAMVVLSHYKSYNTLVISTTCEASQNAVFAATCYLLPLRNSQRTCSIIIQTSYVTVLCIFVSYTFW
jgi:hypothetical protein